MEKENIEEEIKVLTNHLSERQSNILEAWEEKMRDTEGGSGKN